jgi:hypothetical protein
MPDLGGFPDGWQWYTPKWTTGGTAPFLGNGTLYSRWRWVAPGLVYYRQFFQGGSTTTYGTSSWSFSLPFRLFTGTPAVPGGSGNLIQTMSALILDQGADTKLAGAVIASSAESIGYICPEGGNAVANNSPMTWASTDILILQGLLETANA